MSNDLGAITAVLDAPSLADWSTQVTVRPPTVRPSLGSPERLAEARVASIVGNGGFPPPSIFVPVVTSRNPSVYIGTDSNAMTAIPVQSIRYDLTTVAISDLYMQQSSLSQRDIVASMAMYVAANNSQQLLSFDPVSSTRDPNSFVTYYNFYATNAATTAITQMTDSLNSFATAVGNASNIITNNFIFTGGWEETPAQEVARQARDQRLKVVAQKADRLLLAHLTDRQRKTFEVDKYFDVRSASGRLYRLKPHISGNVSLLDAWGTPVRRYCAFGKDPGGSLPMGDHLFVQMMALQYDECSFLRAANTWDLLRPNHPFVGQGVDADMPMLELAAA